MTPLLLLALGVGAIFLILLIEMNYYAAKIMFQSKGKCVFVVNEHTDALGYKRIADCLLCDRRFIIWKWEELVEHDM